jgi:hypothetical protein
MTDKPDMCAALRKWAQDSLLSEPLAIYIDAWEAERAAAKPAAKPVDYGMPMYGNIPWDALTAAVGEARGSTFTPDPSYHVGHQMAGINMNSLNRIVSKFVAAKDARIAELSQALQKSIDSNVDKIMAMTDDQVAALTRLDGSNPEDSARLGKQACELAIAAVRIAEQDEEIARLCAELARVTALMAPAISSMKQQEKTQ